jgi:hypothetical protein
MAPTTLTRDVQPATADATDVFCIDLALGTSVMTLQGEMPVEHVLPDDRLVTRSGAMPVLAVSSRSSDTNLLRISARALGHDRPAEDVFVDEDQQILIRDWRARALFGQPEASVPAARLIDGTHIRREPGASIRMIRITLPRAAVLYAGGLELVAARVRVTA